MQTTREINRLSKSYLREYSRPPATSVFEELDNEARRHAYHEASHIAGFVLAGLTPDFVILNPRKGSRAYCSEGIPEDGIFGPAILLLGLAGERHFVPWLAHSTDEAFGREDKNGDIKRALPLLKTYYRSNRRVTPYGMGRVPDLTSVDRIIDGLVNVFQEPDVANAAKAIAEHLLMKLSRKLHQGEIKSIISAQTIVSPWWTGKEGRWWLRDCYEGGAIVDLCS